MFAYGFTYCSKTFKAFFRPFFHHFIQNVIVGKICPITALSIIYQTAKQFCQIKHIGETGIYTVIVFLRQSVGGSTIDFCHKAVSITILGFCSYFTNAEVNYFYCSTLVYENISFANIPVNNPMCFYVTKSINKLQENIIQSGVFKGRKVIPYEITDIFAVNVLHKDIACKNAFVSIIIVDANDVSVIEFV